MVYTEHLLLCAEMLERKKSEVHSYAALYTDEQYSKITNIQTSGEKVLYIYH